MRNSLYSPPYQWLAESLRNARLEAGLTQADMAKATGRTQAYISKFELGQLRLDVVDFVLFARVLNMDASLLIADLEQQIAKS